MINSYFDACEVDNHEWDLVRYTLFYPSPPKEFHTYAAKDYFYNELFGHFELDDFEEEDFSERGNIRRALSNIKTTNAASWKQFTALKRRQREMDEKSVKLKDLRGIAKRKVKEDQAVYELEEEECAEWEAKWDAEDAEAEVVKKGSKQSGHVEHDSDNDEVVDQGTDEANDQGTSDADSVGNSQQDEESYDDSSQDLGDIAADSEG